MSREGDMEYRNIIVQEDMGSLLEYGIPLEKLKDKKVLITGANGMLATYLAYFFMYLNRSRNWGIQVTALSRSAEKAEKRFGEFEDDTQFNMLIQDVCDEIRMDGDLDYIIHAAGDASPYAILNDPAGIVKANTAGTLNILELARRKGAKILYTSTREVYGKAAPGLEEIRETDFGSLDPMEQRACYPESKRMAETMIQSYYHQYGVEASVVRIAHSYGPGMNIENDGRVMADFISDVVHGRNIVLKSTGDAVRAFCYITDAVAGMLFAMLSEGGLSVYNVANETEEYPIRDVAETLVSLFPEKGLKVVFDIPETMSAGYSRMGRVRLCTRKISDLGWKPRIPLAEGMKRTVESFGRQQMV